jgi:GNAT superfamily N-acetyltransferase
MVLRPARSSDLPILADAWYAMLEEDGLLAQSVAPSWRELLVADFEAGLLAGTSRRFVIEVGQRVAATGVVYLNRNPAAVALTGLTATLAGIYTFPAYRRRGYARAIVARLLEYCREEGCHAVRLRASAQGRPLYEQFGFVPTDDMVLSLSP